MRWKKFVDDRQNFSRCGVRRLIQQIDETRRQQQEKRNSGEKDVERNPTGQKENVVFAAVVPDTLRVVAKQPAEPGRKPALRPLPSLYAALVSAMRCSSSARDSRAAALPTWNAVVTRR